MKIFFPLIFFYLIKKEHLFIIINLFILNNYFFNLICLKLFKKIYLVKILNFIILLHIPYFNLIFFYNLIIINHIFLEVHLNEFRLNCVENLFQWIFYESFKILLRNCRLFHKLVF